jgi:hypothetical protein
VAQHKGHELQGQSKDKIVPKTMKGKMLGKRKRSSQEGGKGIKGLGSRRPLHLRKEKTTVKGIRGRSSGQRSHLGNP